MTKRVRKNFFSESAPVGERRKRTFPENHFRVRCEAKDKHRRLSPVKTSRVIVRYCTIIWVEPWSTRLHPIFDEMG